MDRREYVVNPLFNMNMGNNPADEIWAEGDPEDYDHVLNHPRRHNLEGTERYQVLRGPRRKIDASEAQSIVDSFEQARYDSQGNPIFPRLLKREKAASGNGWRFRRATLQEVIDNVYAKRAKPKPADPTAPNRKKPKAGGNKRKSSEDLPEHDPKPAQLPPRVVDGTSNLQSTMLVDVGAIEAMQAVYQGPAPAQKHIPASDVSMEPSREETLREYIERYAAALHDKEERRKRYRDESQAFRKILDCYLSMAFTDKFPSEQSRIEYHGYISARKDIDNLWIYLNTIYASPDSSTAENTSLGGGSSSGNSPGSSDNSDGDNSSDDDDGSRGGRLDEFGGKNIHFVPEGGGNFRYNSLSKGDELGEDSDDASASSSEQDSVDSSTSGCVLVEHPEGVGSDGKIGKVDIELDCAPQRDATSWVGIEAITAGLNKIEVNDRKSGPEDAQNEKHNRSDMDKMKEPAVLPTETYKPPKPLRPAVMEEQNETQRTSTQGKSPDKPFKAVCPTTTPVRTPDPVPTNRQEVDMDNKDPEDTRESKIACKAASRTGESVTAADIPVNLGHRAPSEVYPGNKAEDLQEYIKKMYTSKKVSFADTGLSGGDLEQETTENETCTDAVAETTATRDTGVANPELHLSSATSIIDQVASKPDDSEDDIGESNHSDNSSVNDVKDLIKTIKGSHDAARMTAEIVLNCMRTNKTVNAQWQCLKIMWENCKEDRATVEAFMLMDAPNDIVTAMKEHNDFKVMKNGCGAIWSMCVDSRTTIKLVNSGACKQVVEALKQFGQDQSLAQYATGALQSFSVERGARKILLDCDACRVVIHAMERHESCSMLQKHGCKFLSNCSIAKEGDVRGSAYEVPTDAVWAVADALLNPKGSDSLMKEGCLALKNFIYDEKKLEALCQFQKINQLQLQLDELCQKGNQVAGQHARTVLKRIRSTKVSASVRSKSSQNPASVGSNSSPTKIRVLRNPSTMSVGTAATAPSTISMESIEEESAADSEIGYPVGPKHLDDNYSVSTGITEDVTDASSVSTAVTKHIKYHTAETHVFDAFDNA